MKIVCLGNEFIEEDSFAKEVGKLLAGAPRGVPPAQIASATADKVGTFEIVNIRDSFELMSIASSGEDFVVLDVVQGLEEVRRLKVEDLRVDGIVSAHDFDAAYVLKLMGGDVGIIGIPQLGDAAGIASLVERKIRDFTGGASNL